MRVEFGKYSVSLFENVLMKLMKWVNVLEKKVSQRQLEFKSYATTRDQNGVCVSYF